MSKLFLNTYINVPSIHYEEVIVAMEVKMYMHKLSDYMDKVAMTETAKNKSDLYYVELRRDEQPRARSTAPA